MSRWLVHPLAPLVILSLMTALFLGAHVLVRMDPSPETGFLLTFGWSLMLVLWMDADARFRRRLPCFDFGMLAAIAFPFSVFWYCFWSRRWRGVVLLLLLGGLYVVPYMVAGFVYELVSFGR
jgi:hypothetical protein